MIKNQSPFRILLHTVYVMKAQAAAATYLTHKTMRLGPHFSSRVTFFRAWAFFLRCFSSLVYLHPMRVTMYLIVYLLSSFAWVKMLFLRMQDISPILNSQLVESSSTLLVPRSPALFLFSVCTAFLLVRSDVWWRGQRFLQDSAAAISS